MSATPTTPQRLYLMQVATLPPKDMPVVCYLVQTSDRKNVLIDTGLPDPALFPSDLSADLGVNVIEQLASIYVQPEDVDFLICTHFDVDHSGHNSAFPRAEFIVQQSHYEAAFTNSRFAASRPEWDQPRERFRFINGDLELLPGLNIIETNGHVPGHQSVLVRLPNTGAVLLTIDAAHAESKFTTTYKTEPRHEAEAGERRSVRKLIELAERENVSLVIFGHDVEQWKGLKKLPEFYD
jgi:N-acyl homoserine lactone hydrolase